MSDELRDLLNRVAAGELSPEEAQARLEEARAAEASPDTADQPAAPPAPPPPPPPTPVHRISIRASAVRLVVVADPTVDTAVAEGPHRVSHDGDTLTVHSDLGAGEYQAEPPRSAFTTWLASVNKAGSTLRVRVNPDLPIDVLNVAGSLELSGVRAPASVGVEAGSARLHDGAGALTLSVASGSADVDWQFHGQSSVSTDLGSARVAVQPGSDISIHAEATLGLATVRLADGTTIKASSGPGRGSATPEQPPVVVGAGSGRLDVTSRLGSLVVTVL
ncbi:MAG: hypothetical protein MUF35_03400 [Candidatus Nanopelagicales bacterium]|nr:hypothetical protein [Candidatus Nanopelagicales bacterium]